MKVVEARVDLGSRGSVRWGESQELGRDGSPVSLSLTLWGPGRVSWPRLSWASLVTSVYPGRVLGDQQASVLWLMFPWPQGRQGSGSLAPLCQPPSALLQKLRDGGGGAGDLLPALVVVEGAWGGGWE